MDSNITVRDTSLPELPPQPNPIPQPMATSIESGKPVDSNKTIIIATAVVVTLLALVLVALVIISNNSNPQPQDTTTPPAAVNPPGTTPTPQNGNDSEEEEPEIDTVLFPQYLLSEIQGNYVFTLEEDLAHADPEKRAGVLELASPTAASVQEALLNIEEYLERDVWDLESETTSGTQVTRMYNYTEVPAYTTDLTLVYDLENPSLIIDFDYYNDEFFEIEVE